MNRDGGRDAALYFHYIDPDNWYRARIEYDPQYSPSYTLTVDKMLYGSQSTVAWTFITAAEWWAVKVKCAGSSIKVWLGSTLEITTADSDIPWGAVGLSGWQAKFKDFKAGYDNNNDNDIEDAGDYVVLDDAFDGTSVTLNADHGDETSDDWDGNGNLLRDPDYRYAYDAWNNLVKVTAQNETDVVVAQYAYFGDDRRASKQVKKRGDLDGTTYFFYDGQEIVEERDGSENLVQQYIYGPNQRHPPHGGRRACDDPRGQRGVLRVHGRQLERDRLNHTGWAAG